MAEAQKLTVRPRVVLGKKVSRLRRDGILPGVVYGGRADSTPLETDLHAFERGYRRWGNTTLLSLQGLDGDIPALVHGVARDSVSGKLLHVDFQRVSLTEKTHADVPLHFVHESPAVRTLGAVLVHAMARVRVEALPQDIPHRVDVDLSGLVEIDDAIYVRDLKVDIATVRILDDGDELVVKAVPVRVEEEKPVAAPTAEAAAAEAGAPAEGEADKTAGAAPAAKGAEAAKSEPAKGKAEPARGKGEPAKAKAEPSRKG